MFVITVTFEVRPDKAKAFSAAVQVQAGNSLRHEEACRLFDVCAGLERPNRFFLYEIYDDEAAFQRHLETDHFRDFDRKVADMVIAKSVESWEKLA